RNGPGRALVDRGQALEQGEKDVLVRVGRDHLGVEVPGLGAVAEQERLRADGRRGGRLAAGAAREGENPQAKGAERPGDQRRRRTAAPSVQSPVAIRIHAEGSGTGVKVSVSWLPMAPTENMPPWNGFWKSVVSSTLNWFEPVKPVIGLPADSKVHE